MQLKKIACLTMAALLSLPVLAGCNKGGDTSSALSEEEQNFKIVDEKITLTYAKIMYIDDMVSIKEWNENEAYKKAEELTNIHIDFVDVNYSNYQDYYTTMWASSSLPDIIEEAGVAPYPGGYDKAIDDGVVLNLADYLDEYAPNYQKIRNEYDNIRRLTMTDKGYIPGFNMVQTKPQMEPSGLVIRQDWLDEIGYDMPTTLEELHDVLVLFKKEKKARIPLLNYNAVQNCLTAPFNFDNAPQLDGSGKVVYGPATDGAREYVKLMHDWYNEGLFGEQLAYPDYATEANKGDVGVWNAGFWAIKSQFGNIADPNAVIEPMPFMKTADGSYGKCQVFSYAGDFGVTPVLASINAKSQYKIEAIKWLDFWYSDYGTTLANFGVEGISYEVVDGENKYTSVMEPTDTETFRNKQSRYFLQSAPFNRYEARLEGEGLKYLEENEQRANKVWGETLGMEYNLPPVSLTTEENVEATTIKAELQAYVSTAFPAFIEGDTPIEGGWDTYMQELRNKGLDRLCEIYQQAYDRYLQR